ncbi:histidine phosphatase family protein [Acidaminococcus sp. LBK-2]|uniref:histidine phosphatase family protein n=1 Tax=Acidaminococcus sp. LBK-2 TaxID=3456956 RepID=UPI003FA44FB1
MILLIRHGEADHHVKELTGGWTDSALTVRGKRQFQQLADRLAWDFSGRNLPRIVSSDLQRARMGAEIIARELGVDKVECFAFLREKNNGKAAGLSQKEARMFYHPPVTGRELDHVNYDGGETRRSFYERTVRGFRELEDREQDLIVVSHKGTIQNILFDWLGLSIDEVADKKVSFDIRPASLTILGINKWGEHAVFALNDTSYLWKQGPVGIFRYPYGE